MRFCKHDLGMVTAELAVTILAFVFLLLAATGVGVTMLAKLRCTDAAYAGARAAARGEDGAERAGRAAGNNAHVSIDNSGDTVTVTVRTEVHTFGPLLPAITVEASAVAAQEPGVLR